MPQDLRPGTMAAVSKTHERVGAAAAHWRLTVGEALTGGSRSAVYAVRDDAGRDLVLKLPGSHSDGADGTAAEVAALLDWASTGATIRLVDATADALLLVRARPGIPMPWQPQHDLDETIELVGDLLRRLWRTPPGTFRYSTIAQLYPGEERTAREDAQYEQHRRGEPDRGRPGLLLLPAAAATAERLVSTTTAPALLHGDFLTKNLLRDDPSPNGWVAIDPRPQVGDPAADVATFAAYQPSELILPIAERLAVRTAVDPRRVLSWAAIWTVHQAAQAWRDDQPMIEQLVDSPTIKGLLRS